MRSLGGLASDTFVRYLGPMLTFEPVSWQRSARLATLALGAGSVVAQEVGRNLTRFPMCWLLDPVGEDVNDDHSVGSVEHGAADHIVDACVGTFIACVKGAKTVLVEEEAEPDATPLAAPHMLVDSFVLRWADVADGLLESSRLLHAHHRGRVGGAFLSSRSPTELFLEPGTELSAPQVAAIVHSIRAVLVPMIGPGVMVAFCRDD